MSDQDNPNDSGAWDRRREEDDEDFGLPEINFDSDDEDTSDPEPTSSYDDDSASLAMESDEPKHEYQVEEEPQISDNLIDLEEEEERRGSGVWLWVAIFILVALSAVALYVFEVIPGFGGSREEVVDKPDVEIPEPDTTTPAVVYTPEPEPVIEPEPTTGEITTINAYTQRYYVVVNSFVDEDLAMDYAKELSADGLDITILAPPEGQKGMYRVTVDNFSSYSDADARAKDLRSTLNPETWAFRY